MRLAWISFASSQRSLASHRYRVLIPAQALRNAGHTVDLIEPPALDGTSWGNYDALIVGKLLPLSQNAAEFAQVCQKVIKAIAEARAAGVTIAADFNDDHFETSGLSTHWQQMARSCDVAVASTPELEKRVLQFGATRTAVIGDPAAAPMSPARTFQPTLGLVAGLMKLLPGASATRLRLVWFGARGSWPAMAALVPKLIEWSARTPLHFTAVTDGVQGLENELDQATYRSKGQMLTEFVPWSEDTQWAALSRAHVALLPASVDKGFARAKSANRLIDSIQSGCWTIASPIPAYEEFGAYADVTEDFTSALDRYLLEPNAVAHRIEAGQSKIRSKYSATAISDLWIENLRRPAVARSAASFRLESADSDVQISAPVRLNLGCGDKLLAGYINVDVVQERAGKQPDVICDIRQLERFDTDHADEVLAVHVVEHFWRWEVVAILREWVRVLKPGGRMVLECPNLISACEAFLANPEQASKPGVEGQRSMWVFYGDPRWTDPLMVHRWGYTPQSLGQIMMEAGLQNVRQEAAQFKLREPRDMRIVGIKP